MNTSAEQTPQLPFEHFPSILNVVVTNLLREISNQRVLSPQEKELYLAELATESLTTSQNRVARGKPGRIEQQLPVHFNILSATILQLLTRLTALPTLPDQTGNQGYELYCDIVDDAGLVVENTTVAHYYARRVLEIINRVGLDYCVGSLILADIRLNGHVEKPDNQSHYRVKVKVGTNGR